MSLASSSRSKRRRFSSPEDANAVVKRSCETAQHGYGDTYATRNAFVHNGDNLHFHHGASPSHLEVQQMQASLAFPGMHDRYESLRDAQGDTYWWIWNRDSEYDGESKERRQPISTFFDWYKAGSGIYWITGKPGSGKSTLMKYLVEHIGSYDMISPRPDLIILSFFLWIGGTGLQRRRLGCLKSLLWQLLHNSIAQQVTVHNCRLYFKNAWSENRLEMALLTTLRQLEGPIILFVDGLDEGEDHEELLNLLRTLDAPDNVKTCVSSRPEPVFVDRLQGSPRLKVHELNRGDIMRFIEQNLLQDQRIAAINSNPHSHYERNSIRDLALQIEMKSEGVFLWVHLVIKELLRGVSNKDDIRTLSRRLEQLPSDILDLYEDMLQHSQNDTKLYKEDVSLYLSLVLHRNFNLVEFCFAVDDELRHKFLQPSILDDPVETMTEIPCDTVETWVRARTAGLVDVVTPYSSPYLHHVKDFNANYRENHYQDVPFWRYLNLNVKIVHRTAHDFLLNTVAGKLLLNPSAEMDSRIKDICFQTKLVYELVVPGLLGVCVGTSPTIRVLDCDACKDEDVLARLRGQGEGVLQFLYHARLVQPDRDFLCERNQREMDVDTRAAKPFPSSSHAELDLAPILLVADRYRATKLWLTESGSMNDRKYLSILLALLIQKVSLTVGYQIHHYKNKDFWRLLDTLISNDADVHMAITSDSEETVFLPGEILYLDGLSDGGIPGLGEFLGATKFLDAHLVMLSKSSCYDCHMIWFDNLNFSEDFLIWGDFCLSNTSMRPTYKLIDGEHMSSRPKDDRILVLATQWTHDLARLRDLPLAENSERLTVHDMMGSRYNPIMWTISETDSHLLTKTVQNSDTLERSSWLEQSTWRIFVGSIVTEDSNEWDIFCEILARSPTVSFAGAMRHMGKSEKIIHTFFEKEAKRMALEPAKIQKGWKEWYWGSDVPPPRHASGEVTELVES